VCEVRMRSERSVQLFSKIFRVRGKSFDFSF
jgi:hypothetical protein